MTINMHPWRNHAQVRQIVRRSAPSDRRGMVNPGYPAVGQGGDILAPRGVA